MKKIYLIPSFFFMVKTTEIKKLIAIYEQKIKDKTAEVWNEKYLP